jgi:uncharacterized membrane protein YjgN (DUF898 family)
VGAIACDKSELSLDAHVGHVRVSGQYQLYVLASYLLVVFLIVSSISTYVHSGTRHCFLSTSVSFDQDRKRSRKLSHCF